MIASLFRRRAAAAAAAGPRVPDGVRVYAIGDIHGRDDLFAALLARIDADSAARGAAETRLVLVGDLVDRGPDSAAAVERARGLVAAGAHLILGNHEEILLGAADGDRKALRLFSRVGGRATAISYGIAAEDYDAADFDDLAALLARHLPPEHRRLLEAAEDVVRIGDYAFVHAGIRPGVPLAEQVPADLRWIRDSFLDHRGPHEAFVVHGHTITDAPDVQANRLGIDTGAYASGRLTAVGLEGAERWFLSTG